jgi:hypothetical protein
VKFTIYLFIYGFTVLLLDLGRFFSSLILYTVGRTPWMGDQPVARPLPTHRTTQTQTSMLRVEYEPTIPALERVKKVHALKLGGDCDRQVYHSPHSNTEIKNAWSFTSIYSCFNDVILMRKYSYIVSEHYSPLLWIPI